MKVPKHDAERVLNNKMQMLLPTQVPCEDTDFNLHDKSFWVR